MFAEGCDDTEDGAGGAGTTGSETVAVAVTSTGTGTGECTSKVADGVCEISKGELCGTCADCVPGSIDCGGGCVADGACTNAEPCTCADCAASPHCGGIACKNDGWCDAFYEGCGCMDCTADPLCTR